MQSFVDNASGLHVVAGAARIKSDNIGSGYLLHHSDPLVADAVEAIKRHFATDSTNLPLLSDQVGNYLAASCLSHTMDGWVYLSHSIDSLLKGDPAVAVHLAYYAELRASMSFLSTEGIGVFHNKHLNIDASNVVNKCPLGQGTHETTWNVIDKWTGSSLKTSSHKLLDVFSVDGKSFKQWVTAFPYSGELAGQAVVIGWLKEWNLDVRLLKGDRAIRNVVSYRPQRIKLNNPARSINEIIENLTTYWDVLEPYNSNRFQTLDKHLLRILLRKMYSSLSTATTSSTTFEDAIRSTFDALGLNHSGSMISFLLDDSNEHPLLVEAKKDAVNTLTSNLNPLSVIARATLMLRLSTGVSSQIFSDAGVTKTDLAILWDAYGIENGFWKSGNIPTDFSTLWEDVKEHIEDIGNWADSRKPSLVLSELYSDSNMPKSFNYFKQFNRAALWGMSM